MRPVEPDETFTVSIAAPSGYAAGSSMSATGTILNDDTAPSSLIVFARNSATNAKLAAMLARVAAGTGRGKVVWKGDSTTVGHGGGSNADSFGLTGARVNRVPAPLAARLTGAGVASVDCGVVGDWAVESATGQNLLAAYNPQIARNGFDVVRDETFAGHAFFRPASSPGGKLHFTPAIPVDTFEIVVYRSAASTFTPRIDNQVPTSGPSSFTTDAAGGFTRITVRASGVGTHTLSLIADNRSGALQSVRAYDSTVAAVDHVVHAALGARAEHQAATGGNAWRNQEALGFETPDLTVINVGLNDMSAGTTPASFAASIGAMIDTAKVTGDALVIFPPPVGGSYNNGVVAMRDAAASTARAKGVSFLDLYSNHGSAFSPALQARMFDGVVHPKAELYDEIASRIHQAIGLMTA